MRYMRTCRECNEIKICETKHSNYCKECKEIRIKKSLKIRYKQQLQGMLNRVNKKFEKKCLNKKEVTHYRNELNKILNTLNKTYMGV